MMHRIRIIRRRQGQESEVRETNIHNRIRSSQNEKVNKMASEILEECKKRKFSLADIEDLSFILPQRIEKVIESAKEKTTDY